MVSTAKNDMNFEATLWRHLSDEKCLKMPYIPARSPKRGVSTGQLFGIHASLTGYSSRKVGYHGISSGIDANSRPTNTNTRVS